MNKKGKKYIAPIIIALILTIYYLGIGILFLYIDGAPLIVRLLLVIIPFALIFPLIYVLVQRIKEIRKGEYDDLRNY